MQAPALEASPEDAERMLALVKEILDVGTALGVDRDPAAPGDVAEDPLAGHGAAALGE